MLLFSKIIIWWRWWLLTLSSTGYEHSVDKKKWEDTEGTYDVKTKLEQPDFGFEWYGWFIDFGLWVLYVIQFYDLGFNLLFIIFLDSDYLFKLLLIGDSGGGKSCLLLRFSGSHNLFSWTH